MGSELLSAARIASRFPTSVAGSAVLLFLWTSFTQAAPINYGDFVGSTVTYRMVTEDSGTDTVPPGMYGMPSVGGNTLNFNPVGFDSETSGPNADITDGQLLFMVESNNKETQAILNIKINEIGDTTLAGNVPLGSLGTSSSIRMAAVVEIVEVDGVAITPITLSGMSASPLPVLMPVYTLLPSNSPTDGTWQLGVDGNGGPSFTSQWNGELFVDVQDALNKSGMSYTRGATRVTVNLNNVLAATSETGTSASVGKKRPGDDGAGIGAVDKACAVVGARFSHRELLLRGGRALRTRRGSRVHRGQCHLVQSPARRRVSSCP
jgi:hypothetical protein